MKTLVASLIFFIPITAFSGGVISNTKIVALMNDLTYLNYTFIQTEGSAGASRYSSHCHTNTRWDFVLDTSSEFGKQMNANLLAALAAGKTVRLEGKNTCPIGQTEELRRLEIFH